MAQPQGPSIQEAVAQAVAMAMSEWTAANQNVTPARHSEAWKRAEMKKLKDIRLEKYSHTKSGYTWTLFKSQLRMQLATVGHDDEFKDGEKLAILSNLTGLAASLAQRVTNNISNLTLEQVNEQLAALFQPPAESAMAKETFMSMRQMIGESVQTYISRKQESYMVAYPLNARGEPLDENFLFKEIIRGVYHRGIRNTLTREKFGSLKALNERALELVAAEREIVQRGDADDKSLDGLATSYRSQFDQFGQENMDVSAMLEAINSVASGVKCYNCSKTGHLARDCPQPRRNDPGRSRDSGRTGGRPSQGARTKTKGACRRCWTPGHFERQCEIPEHKLDKQRKKNEKNKPDGAKGSVRQLQDEQPRDSDDDSDDSVGGEFHQHLAANGEINHLGNLSGNPGRLYL